MGSRQSGYYREGVIVENFHINVHTRRKKPRNIWHICLLDCCLIVLPVDQWINQFTVRVHVRACGLISMLFSMVKSSATC